MPDSPKYNILMLGWEFYPVFAGGMGVVTSEIVQGLTDKNIGVHFVIPRLPKKIEVEKVNITSAVDYQGSDETKDKINTESKFFKKTYIDTIFTPYETKNLFSTFEMTDAVKTKNGNGEKNQEEIITGNKIYHDNLLKDIKMFEDKTAEIALESNFDLIHAHDWLTFRAAIKAKYLTGKPVVLHVHATEFDRSGENVNKIIFDIERECLQEADFVVAVSEKTRMDLITKYGLDPQKVFTIHNSTNYYQGHQRSILSKDENIVMFLARITMQKGPEYFIYAAEKVLRYLPNTTFVMVGDGDKLPESIRLVNDLGIEKNFIFTGFISGKAKDRIYASADLFVMPSVSEPFGIVALEAIKSGTPVIVSKTSGAAEIIHNSLKVDFWDTDKLANMIHAAVKYKSLNQELLERQSNDLNSQNWNHQVDVLIKVYELATKKK